FQQRMYALAVSPSGNVFVTGGEGPAHLRLHDRRERTVRILDGSWKGVTQTGLWAAAVGHQASTPWILAIHAVGPGTTQKDQDWWVNSVAFSPDGRKLAAGYQKGTVYLWDLSLLDGKREYRDPQRQEKEDRIPVLTVTFSPDGRLLAV